MPDVPAPDELEQSSWTATFDRHSVPPEQVGGGSRDGAGRSVAWMKVNDDLGDPTDPAAQLMHRCWLAYLSDDLPTDAVIRAHPFSRSTKRTTICSARASTTRSGSIVRCAPIDGISTTSPATTSWEDAGCRSVTSSATTASTSPRSPRRSWSATSATAPTAPSRADLTCAACRRCLHSHPFSKRSAPT